MPPLCLIWIFRFPSNPEIPPHPVFPAAQLFLENVLLMLPAAQLFLENAPLLIPMALLFREKVLLVLSVAVPLLVRL